MNAPAKPNRLPCIPPGSLAIFATLFVLLAAAPLPAAPAAAEEGGAPSELFTVRAQSLTAEVSIGGVVVPFREVTFRAQTAGRVVRIAGKEGTEIERGGLIVALDEDDLRAQRQQIVAQIRTAEAALANATVQYQRELTDPAPNNMMQQMLGPMGNMFGGTTPAARNARLFELQTQIQSAQQALTQARFRLQELDARARDTRSVAPFAGVILEKMVEVGDPVQPGQSLIRFGDTEFLQLQADVTARLALALQPGSQVSARLDDPDKTLVRVRVNQVFPSADPTRGTIRVKFDLPMGSPVTAGMYAEVLVPDSAVAEQQFLYIPEAAVVYRGGLPMARVAGPQGRTELRLLRLGDLLDNGMVAVLTGLRAGEQVIVSGGP